MHSKNNKLKKKPNFSEKRKFCVKRKIHKKPSEVISVKKLLYKCKLCDETKPNKKMFLKHLETHLGTPITCRKCRYTFNSGVAYDWHIRHLCNLKRKPVVKSFKCNECPKVSYIFKQNFVITTFFKGISI